MEDGVLDLIRVNFSRLQGSLTPNIYEASALSGHKCDRRRKHGKSGIGSQGYGLKHYITGGHLERETLDLILYGGKFYKLRQRRSLESFTAPDVPSPL